MDQFSRMVQIGEDNSSPLTMREQKLSAGYVRQIVVPIKYDNNKGTVHEYEVTELDQHSSTLVLTFKDTDALQQFISQDSTQLRASIMSAYDAEVKKILEDHNGYVDTDAFDYDLKHLNEVFVKGIKEEYNIGLTKITSAVEDGEFSVEPELDILEPTARNTTVAPVLGG